MRQILMVSTLLLSFSIEDLFAALPARCPKIDAAMLKADASRLLPGGELTLDGYLWKVTGGNLCHPSCGDFYQQTLQSGMTTQASFTAQNGRGSCSYKFMRDGKEIANLTLTTDESMKLPEHSPERWAAVPKDPEELMEKEEEHRDDPRIRME